MPKIKNDKKFRNHKQGTSAAVQAKQGLRFNKEFGQHILKNPLIITSMIEKVNIKTYKKILFQKVLDNL